MYRNYFTYYENVYMSSLSLIPETEQGRVEPSLYTQHYRKRERERLKTNLKILKKE